MSFKKQYLKSRPICKVTFKMHREAVDGAKSVHIVGDFNNWDTHENPMKQMKNGDYMVTLDLDAGREYQYRYLLDGTIWINDWQADKYVTSYFGNVENSVIIL
jgi:1,4-alpha-glucan branching enzyme